MEYKEPNKRVTKNDKKTKSKYIHKKHVRNILKQKEHSILKRNDGPVQSSKHPLLPNGRVGLR